MRVVFAGTPPFAVPALEAIVAAGHEVPLVLTQPDRPAGRGLKLTPSAVAQCADRLRLAISKPATLKDAAAQESLRAIAPDVMVVAAYGLLLPPAVLSIPVQGCINIHASLLPRWRGAAPIHRALLAGDAKTGVGIMRMEAGLDTGPVLLEAERPIGGRDTTGTLTEALARLGAQAIVEALPRLAQLTPAPQDDSRATYAPKISKAEARIDWAASNAEVDRRIRAFDPFPGAEARLGEETVKIWRARPVDATGAPGEIVRADDDGIVVACGSGGLLAEVLQRPGGRRLPAAEFLRGRQRVAGERLT